MPDNDAVTRLDQLLHERGLAETRSRAQALVMAGRVRVDGRVVTKAGTAIPESAALDVDQGPAFVSRGGDKLATALAAFGIDVAGLSCVDVGASTGGFTDCLLQAGAAHVTALDVGLVQVLARPYRLLPMVKPQFEAGKGEGRKGVVRDPSVQAAVLERIAEAAREAGGVVLGACETGHPGPAGNREFFLHIVSSDHPEATSAPADPLPLLRDAVA